MLDWTRSALELSRQVRGLNAWPVAQTKLQDKIMRVWRAEVIDGSNSVTPGLILNDEKHVDVGTGGGVLRLLEIQMPGKSVCRRQIFKCTSCCRSAAELNGISLQAKMECNPYSYGCYKSQAEAFLPCLLVCRLRPSIVKEM